MPTAKWSCDTCKKEYPSKEDAATCEELHEEKESQTFEALALLSELTKGHFTIQKVRGGYRDKTWTVAEDNGRDRRFKGEHLVDAVADMARHLRQRKDV